MQQFTKTEALARLRTLGTECRRQLGLPSNARAEVGHRYIEVVTLDPTTDSVYAEGDDLRDFAPLPDAAGADHVRTHGAIVHLYLSQTTGFGRYAERELVDVLVCWMGTPDQAPIANVDKASL